MIPLLGNNVHFEPNSPNKWLLDSLKKDDAAAISHCELEIRIDCVPKFDPLHAQVMLVTFYDNERVVWMSQVFPNKTLETPLSSKNPVLSDIQGKCRMGYILPAIIEQLRRTNNLPQNKQ